MGLAIGVDIGGTKVAAGVVDDSGAILDRERRDTPGSDVRANEDVLVDVVEVAEDLVAVLHHVFGKLVECLLGRLRLEFLRPVPLRVFVERHEWPRRFGG